MKLNKIILSLLLICSFSYGEMIRDVLNNWENDKKANLEKAKSLKNPESFLDEFDHDYREYLDDEISVTRFMAIHFTNRLRIDGFLGWDYRNDKEINVRDTWEEFIVHNLDVDYFNIRTRFVNSIFGVYTNGYKDKEFRKISTHKDLNNEGYYYLVVGYVERVDENGVFITISRTEATHVVKNETDESTIDMKIFGFNAKEVYIENLPKDTSTYIKNYLKDYYKQYPLVSFIIKGNGLYDKHIPKGSYISGKAYDPHYTSSN